MFGLLLSLLAPAEDPTPDDMLGELVVEASEVSDKLAPLMKLGVELSLDDSRDAARVGEVFVRDLELSGQFELVMPPAGAGPGGGLEAPFDADAWSDRRVDTVVRLQVRRIDATEVEVAAVIVVAAERSGPAFESRVVSPRAMYRVTTHRLVDKVIGAITGYDGPFESRLVFVRTTGASRVVYAIDPDGERPTKISPDGHLATSPAIGPDDTIYYAASVGHGAYRVYRAGDETPLRLEPGGSVFGLAFSSDRTSSAVSIAIDGQIRLFRGDAALSHLQPASKLPMALHPVFSDRGSVAVAGSRDLAQRIYVDDKPISAAGRSASSPDFCEHPEGTRVVYSAGRRATSDLIVSDVRGRSPARITKGAGRNSAPACSPDGRLVAFFSTRTSGEGSGLYVMRLDGRRPRKISSVVGDSLRWERIDGLDSGQRGGASPPTAAPRRTSRSDPQGNGGGAPDVDPADSGRRTQN